MDLKWHKGGFIDHQKEIEDWLAENFNEEHYNKVYKQRQMLHGMDFPTYIISEKNIHIEDSYLISKRADMRAVLATIKTNNPNCEVFHRRTILSLIQEWRGHNLCYVLHIKRSSTKDVDLQIPRKWYEPIGYFILSVVYGIVKIFIR